MPINWRRDRPATVRDVQAIVSALQSLQKQINSLTMEIQKMSGTQSQLDEAIANLQAQVTAETNETVAAVKLINGVPQMINDAVQQALAAGATPAQLQAITDASNTLAANAQGLYQPTERLTL